MQGPPKTRGKLGIRDPATKPLCHGAVTKHRVACLVLCVVWGMHMAKKPKKSDLRRARERIYEQLLKRSQQLASDPARARERHAQLIARRGNANPELV